ncbi:MAG: alpha/beta hydrolase [Acetobacteraceae bacterium]|nr:alpha/beta hydrolase [Acetobacteraceae bacterium]
MLRRRLTAALAGLPALLAGGCSPAAVLNTLAPDRLVADGVPYAPGKRHRLDAYAPRDASGAPVVVFLYGGNWDSGARQMYRFVGGALASHGVVTIIPDYRLYPAARYPAFLQDCAAAVAWARSNAGHFGGDPARMFLLGHSAGAYNAAMLALDPQWLAAAGTEPASHLAGVIGLSGPYDFLPLTDPELIAIFGGANRPETQPVSYVDGRNPPMLLATGDADTTVRPRNSVRLSERICASGGVAFLRLYPGIGHVETIGAFASPLRFLAPTLRDTLAFMGLPIW